MTFGIVIPLTSGRPMLIPLRSPDKVMVLLMFTIPPEHLVSFLSTSLRVQALTKVGISSILQLRFTCTYKINSLLSSCLTCSFLVLSFTCCFSRMPLHCFITSTISYFTFYSGQVFTFSGDDDVWVYINDKLVIDLGGLHIPLSASVNLNTITPALVPGKVYSLDMFHAERHCCGSNFKISTTIAQSCSILTSTTETIPLSGGFTTFDAATQALLGSATISNGLTLVNGALNSVGVFWYTNQQNVGNGFEARFQLTANSIDVKYGFAFVIQRSGPTAVGFGGTALGYRGISNYLTVRIERITAGAYSAPTLGSSGAVPTTYFQVSVEASNGNCLGSTTVWNRM